jgi:hypothetical protein
MLPKNPNGSSSTNPTPRKTLQRKKNYQNSPVIMLETQNNVKIQIFVFIIKKTFIKIFSYQFFARFLENFLLLLFKIKMTEKNKNFFLTLSINKKL